ncbi:MULTISPECIES: transcription elongation factor [Mangrovimonas]|uniref:transcription elongation factor n=1 Tax=Mangrovimonas TaxID=1211036 RepID=UPI00141F0EFD|nr:MULTISPECIES: transcription elongation factor [Mangrovimonas]MCF1422004.1 transcription elongation factor [Mangrovimonas futianensis]NIK91858.1 transcription elongation factor [Mangrovimonas sp. CR14]
MNTKFELLQVCIDHVQKRIESYKSEIALIKESIESNDKSSDDEDDSGNSKLFEDLEKNSQYLSDAQKTMGIIKSINPNIRYETCVLGSLVKTQENSFFISASIGKIDLDFGSYYAISLQSPIGQLMKNKKAGDHIEFNGKTFSILEIK